MTCSKHLKEELIEVKELAVDKDGKMLVWVGEGGQGERRGNGANGETEKLSSQPLAPRRPDTPVHASRAPATDGDVL